MVDEAPLVGTKVWRVEIQISPWQLTDLLAYTPIKSVWNMTETLNTEDTHRYVVDISQKYTLEYQKNPASKNKYKHKGVM